VELLDNHFHVSWRTGTVVVASSDVPADAVSASRGERHYPGLARFLDRDFGAHGMHQDASDPALDEAVLQVRNSAAYEDVDRGLGRRACAAACPAMGPAGSVFAVSFAAD